MTDEVVLIEAVPADNQELNYLIQCNQCGPIETADKDNVHEASMLHMEFHGVDRSNFEKED